MAAAAAALAILGIITLPWIAAISGRYGYFTLTTSGGLNYDLMVSRTKIAVQDICRDSYLCDQPADILFTGEDPISPLLPEQPSTNTKSATSLPTGLLARQMLVIVFNSANFFISHFENYGPLPLIVLILLGIGIWEQKQLLIQWSIITILAYCSGYMILPNEVRYFYPILLLLVILVVLIIQKAVFPSKLISYIVIFASILSMGHPNALWELLRSTPQTACLQDDALAMDQYLRSPMAATNVDISYISYYTGKRTYGIIPGNTPADVVYRNLSELGVRTFLTNARNSLVDTLVTQYGYTIVGQVPLCDRNYIVLWSK
jgi:hypothetical protein